MGSFKIGDLVQLKNGGPKLLVLKVVGDIIFYKYPDGREDSVHYEHLRYFVRSKTSFYPVFSKGL